MLCASVYICVLTPRSKEEVLVQRRALTKIAFPGRWDVSAAGHVAAGETAQATAARELQEELGVVGLPAPERLMETVSVATMNGGSFKEHEFIDVFAVFVDADAQARMVLRLQETEVMDARWMPLREVAAAWKRRDSSFAVTDNMDTTVLDELAKWARAKAAQHELQC